MTKEVQKVDKVVEHARLLLLAILADGGLQ
jgi:hypothetical protein